MNMLGVLGCLVAAAAWGGDAAAASAKVGTRAPAFELPTVDGKTWKPSEAAGARALVVTFIGVECPLMQIYAPRLEKMAQKYKPQGVAFVAINSNVQDSPAEIAAFAREFGLTFPILKDQDARVADAFGATRTPEAFVLDASRTVRYRGRIDDQGRVGFVRLKADRRDLEAALDELLAGKPVSQPELAAVGCLIGRRHEAKKTSTVTYAKEVSRIFQARCVECHRTGEIGPFAMEKYDELVGWADMIAEVVDQQRMPPWFANPEHGKFANDSRLTAEEKKTIADWVAAGAPLGDPKDLPQPRKFHEGWNIGKPDQILAMSDKPFTVPADGTMPYKHFVVDPGWTEDKWLTACEVRPGARPVVHHVFALCIPPGQRNIEKAIFQGGVIAGYAPGTPAFQSPPGMAHRIPAGSKVVFQLHYTPNGRAQADLTQVGFKFCDKSQVKQELDCMSAKNFLFAVPAGAPNHVVKATYKFPEDRYIRNMLPHMHLRGKSFRYIAHYPDGKSEILLDVPRFDFNWQIQYELAEMKFMPKGTILQCIAAYDNSSANPANPDPKIIVTPGEQTWHEMMIGWFGSVTPPRDKVNVELQKRGVGVSLR